MNKPPAKITRAQWIVRIIFAVVFFLNIQCAFQFIVSPEHYLAAYELEGVSGSKRVKSLQFVIISFIALVAMGAQDPF